MSKYTMSTFRLLLVLCKHKWFVLVAGRKTGAPLWRLLIHDLSKLSPIEFSYYAGHYAHGPTSPINYMWAWLHHQNRNPHHWEYWIHRSNHCLVPTGFPVNEPLPMPEWAVKEMVADWMAKRKEQSGQWPTKHHWPWIKNEYFKIQLHAHTRGDVNQLLKTLGLL